MDETLKAELARLLRISGIKWEECEVVALSRRNKRRHSFARDLWGEAFVPRIMKIDIEVEQGESYSLLHVEGHQELTFGNLTDLLPTMHLFGCRTEKLDFGLKAVVGKPW